MPIRRQPHQQHHQHHLQHRQHPLKHSSSSTTDANMKVEVHSAADFLMNLLRVKQAHSSLPEHQLQHFNRSLQTLLVLRFRSHWYPDLPTRGSGYRCIRINGKMDPIVEQAGVEVGLPPPTLRKMLPAELTLWIDPEEVAYRIGENGSICVLYDSSSRTSPSSDVGSAGDSGGEEFVMERVGNKMLQQLNSRAGDSATDGIRTPSPVAHHRRMDATAVRSSPRLNSSSDSGSQMSPPMSPQYHQATAAAVHPHPHVHAHRQQQHHLQQHLVVQQQLQQQQFNHHQQQQRVAQHLYGVQRSNMYQWAPASEEHALRSQC